MRGSTGGYSGIIVTENLWLDDETFIVDGVTMKKEQIGKLKNIPHKVCMSPGNKELLTEIATKKRLQNADVLKIALGKVEK